jgi:hypothetical protein
MPPSYAYAYTHTIVFLLLPRQGRWRKWLSHSVLGVTDRGVALGVEGVDGDLVLGNVVEAVLKGPVSEGVDLF